MDELIYKQQAIDAAKHAWAKGLEPSQYIELLPSVQPKHGKWIDMPYGPSHTKYMCSECGKTIYTNSDYIKEHKFCFSCGAKMDG